MNNSVIRKISTKNRTSSSLTDEEHWHGIANVEADNLAKNLGADLSLKEVQLLAILLQRLAEVQFMTYFEIEELVKSNNNPNPNQRERFDTDASGLEADSDAAPTSSSIASKPIAWKGSELTAALSQLESRQWLSRSEASRGYWELGMRTYMELKPLILAARKADNETDEDDEVMPIVIVY